MPAFTATRLADTLAGPDAYERIVGALASAGVRAHEGAPASDADTLHGIRLACDELGVDFERDVWHRIRRALDALHDDAPNLHPLADQGRPVAVDDEMPLDQARRVWNGWLHGRVTDRDYALRAADVLDRHTPA
jgi:hypothetical protein